MDSFGLMEVTLIVLNSGFVIESRARVVSFYGSFKL